MSGKAIIITAPSGSGKTTLIHHLLAHRGDLIFSISATTRPRRPMETEGEAYHFIDSEEFRKRISRGHFIEWEEVYEGRFYGTLRSEVERIGAAGKNIAFDIDVQGALRLKQCFGANALSVFVRPPSLDALRQRLIHRSTETDETLLKRLSKAQGEMTFADRFDTVIVNDNLELAKKDLERCYDEFTRICL